jgi:hypothetical protein
MFLQGLKYVGKKDVGELVVLTLPPTAPGRKQLFKKGEVKLLNRDITPDIANYLASEYRGVVEFIEVEVDAKMIFGEKLQELRQNFDGELSKEDSMIVFCEVFEVNEVEELKKKNEELKAALKELSELKASLDSGKKPAEKKSSIKRRKSSSKKPKAK